MNLEMPDLEIGVNERGIEQQRLRKSSVFFTVVLSLVTFGVYIPYWFLSRRNAINRLSSEGHMHLGAPAVMLVLYSFLALTMIPVFFLVDGWILAYYDYLQMALSYLGVTLVLYMSFQARTILNECNKDYKLSAWCTFFFHIWYLQYKINRRL